MVMMHLCAAWETQGSYSSLCGLLMVVHGCHVLGVSMSRCSGCCSLEVWLCLQCLLGQLGQLGQTGWLAGADHQAGARLVHVDDIAVGHFAGHGHTCGWHSIHFCDRCDLALVELGLEDDSAAAAVAVAASHGLEWLLQLLLMGLLLLWCHNQLAVLIICGDTCVGWQLQCILQVRATCHQQLSIAGGTGGRHLGYLCLADDRALIAVEAGAAAGLAIGTVRGHEHFVMCGRGGGEIELILVYFIVLRPKHALLLYTYRNYTHVYVCVCVMYLYLYLNFYFTLHSAYPFSNKL